MLFFVILVFGSLMMIDQTDRAYVPLGDPIACLGIFAAFLALTLVATKLAQLRATERLDGTLTAIDDLQHIYSRVQRIHGLLACSCHLTLIFATRWPEFVQYYLGQTRFGLDELVMLLPFLTVLIVGYVRIYPVDRMIRQSLTGDLLYYFEPVQPVWSCTQYVAFQLRFHTLLIAAPLMLLVITKDLLHAHEAAVTAIGEKLLQPFGLAKLADLTGEGILAVAALLTLVIAPICVRVFWACRSLPAGPLRDHLVAIARDAKLSYRDILLWPTHGVVVNAAVVGLFGRMRYILLSDALVESLTDGQIEAVFSHELGHVRRHHLPYFVLFALATFTLVTLIAWHIQVAFALSPNAMQIPMFAVLFATFYILFGRVSRAFERQADIVAVELLSRRFDTATCGHADCKRHQPPLSVNDKVLCRAAAEMVKDTLLRASALNATDRHRHTWRHGSIARRCDAILDQADHPQHYVEFRAKIDRIKMAIILAFALAIAWGCFSLEKLVRLLDAVR